MGMNKVGTLRWDGSVAQARMDNLLSAYYGKDKVHAVLSPYDGLSIGILSSLNGVGYCTAQQPCPVVSGQDAEVPSVKSILKGEQYSTVFKDTRELAKVAANMVDATLSGKQPEINDTKTYNNGVKVVPSYLLKPVGCCSKRTRCWWAVATTKQHVKSAEVPQTTFLRLGIGRLRGPRAYNRCAEGTPPPPPLPGRNARGTQNLRGH